MTTTEFIKLIKDCQSDRKRLYTSHWNYTDPVCIVSVSELEKIEKVNVELLEALQYYKTYSNDSRNLGLISTKISKAIKTAFNIKQI